MARDRYLPSRDYDRIRMGQRDLIDGAGGVNRAGRVLGYAHQVLSRIYDGTGENEERFLRADLIADLEADIDRPVLTAVLAELSGHMLVPLPGETPDADCDLVARVSDVLAEVGDVSARAAEALRDGDITDEEAKRLHGEVMEAQQALARLDLAFEARARLQRAKGAGK